MKGKIVLVPFPFDDFSSLKVRPALCLTEPSSTHNHIIIAFISSKISNYIESTEILLESSDSLFHKTGLKTSSVIKLSRMTTIPKKFIKRELGILPQELTNELHLKLKLLFDLD
uniref:Type II toxin-antitoxin system PemK/MazF family toxin n=1 Tax=Ignavibacterium album TaxID=591197 RepID=A0A832DGU1_9BACT